MLTDYGVPLLFWLDEKVRIFSEYLGRCVSLFEDAT